LSCVDGDLGISWSGALYYDYCLVMITSQTTAKVGEPILKSPFTSVHLTKKKRCTLQGIKFVSLGCSPCKERSTTTSISSSMDEHTHKSDHVPPLSYMGQRARTPIPARRPSSAHPYLPSLRSDPGSTSERSSFGSRCAILKCVKYRAFTEQVTS
jgi:hypothetical protein